MNKEIIEQIQRFYQTKISNSLIFDWGEQHWLQLEPDQTKLQPVVSIATVYPQREQLPHSHFGYHEIVIGLQGECIHWCDNRKITLNKGKIGYISSDSKHHIINFTDESASFLSIIYSHIPESLTSLLPVENVDISELAKRINVNMLIEQFMSMVHMNIFLVDGNGKYMADEKYLPQLCQSCIQERSGDCMLICGVQGERIFKAKTIQCKFGVSVYQTPIIANHNVLGYLSCGYGKLSDIKNYSIPDNMSRSMEEAYKMLPFISRNYLMSVAETLALVSTSFVRLMLNHIKEEEINKYKISLAEERETQMRLTEALNQTQLKFLESQVNPHFLFNTLNTIAQQAVLDGADKIASLTYALSNLLRLSLGKEKSLVTVEEEMDYIKDYLYIQQTRFPDKFTYAFHIEPKINRLLIPLMTLMVLVENTILHGFKNLNRKGVLEIKGYEDGAQAVIEVMDNGCGLPESVAAVIRDLPTMEYNQIALKGIGIKNIFLRLKHYYDGDFTLNFKPLKDGGTVAQIRIPLGEHSLKNGADTYV